MNSRGVTLVEAMVAVSVFSILSIATLTMLQDSRRAFHTTVVFADRQANLALMNRVMQKDGQGSGLSFGNLLINDDDGKKFFEYDPICSVNCERTLTINSAGESFVVITTGLRPLPAVPLDPAKAYTFTASATEGVPGTLTFQSLNYESYFDGITSGAWRKGNLFLLYSPNPVPAYDGSGNVDLSVAPRPLSYLGYVGDDGASRLIQALSGIFVSQDPSGAAIPDEDSFLRRIEGMGGSAVLVLAQPISAIRYILNARNDAGGGYNLVRETFGLNPSDSPAFLSDNALTLEGVRQVTFRRPTIASTGFSFDIKMNAVKGL